MDEEYAKKKAELNAETTRQLQGFEVPGAPAYRDWTPKKYLAYDKPLVDTGAHDWTQ